AGFDTASFGHDLGNHRRSGCPFAAYAKTRDNAKAEQYPDVRCERARGRADRIKQHSQQKRSSAADAVGDLAEDYSANGPANKKNRRQNAGPFERGGLRLGGTKRQIKKRRNTIRRDVI